MKPNVIVIHPEDNVAVALKDIKSGESVSLDSRTCFPARSPIAFSHKILIKNVAAGADIIKYGEVIGQAKTDLIRGDWVHTHNLKIDEE